MAAGSIERGDGQNSEPPSPNMYLRTSGIGGPPYDRNLSWKACQYFIWSAGAAESRRACLFGDPVGAQFADHELAESVVQIGGIVGAARGLLRANCRGRRRHSRGTAFPDCANVIPWVCSPMADRNRTSRSRASVS